MKISSQSGPSPLHGAGVTTLRLQHIHQIHESAGSDAERRAMLAIIQEQFASKPLLVNHAPKVNAITMQSEEEVTNEHGDTLIISAAARQLYEKAADSTTFSSSRSSGSNASTTA